MLSLRYPLAIAAAALAMCEAFEITRTRVQWMDPTEPHGVVQQWYAVGQDSLDNLINHEALKTLKISIPGRVFVSYNHDFGPRTPPPGPSQAAIVRFSGNSEDAFNLFEVVATAPHEIEIRHRAHVRGWLTNVFLLTEISVTQRHQLSQIISTGPADLVIEDGVMINDLQSTLQLQVQGSGNVYVDTRSSTLAAKVEIGCASSGDLYWTMSTLQTAAYSVGIAGSGDFNLVSESLDATMANIALAGSGDLCIEATSFKTDTVKIGAVGSGEASISSASGHCNHEEIAVLGSGDLLLGALQCNDVQLNVAGAGDVYLQATDSIAGSAYGSGDVSYVGNRPKLISDRHDKNVFSTEQKKKYKPIAVPAKSNHATPCRVGRPPPREAVAVTVSESVGPAALGPLIFFALLSLCYLRSQRKSPRRRAPRLGDYTHAAELHPLVTNSMLPQPQPQQQPPQQSQVYV